MYSRRFAARPQTAGLLSQRTLALLVSSPARPGHMSRSSPFHPTAHNTRGGGPGRTRVIRIRKLPRTRQKSAWGDGAQRGGPRASADRSRQRQFPARPIGMRSDWVWAEILRVDKVIPVIVAGVPPPCPQGRWPPEFPGTTDVRSSGTLSGTCQFREPVSSPPCTWAGGRAAGVWRNSSALATPHCASRTP